jgi:hypothetical protein
MITGPPERKGQNPEWEWRGGGYENILFHTIYGFNYYLHFLCLQFLSQTHLNFLFTFGIKLVLFLKSLLFQSKIDKIVHL